MSLLLNIQLVLKVNCWPVMSLISVNDDLCWYIVNPGPHAPTHPKNKYKKYKNTKKKKKKNHDSWGYCHSRLPHIQWKKEKTMTHKINLWVTNWLLLTNCQLTCHKSMKLSKKSQNYKMNFFKFILRRKYIKWFCIFFPTFSKATKILNK